MDYVYMKSNVWTDLGFAKTRLHKHLGGQLATVRVLRHEKRGGFEYSFLTKAKVKTLHPYKDFVALA